MVVWLVKLFRPCYHVQLLLWFNLQSKTENKLLHQAIDHAITNRKFIWNLVDSIKLFFQILSNLFRLL